MKCGAVIAGLLIASMGRAQASSGLVDYLVDEAIKNPAGSPYGVNAKMRRYLTGFEPQLLVRYRRANGGERCRILYALHASVETDSILVEPACREKSVSIRAMGATIVARVPLATRTPERLALLKEILKDRDRNVRMSAAHWVAFREPKSFAWLLKDPDPHIRVEIAISLCKAGDARGARVTAWALAHAHRLSRWPDNLIQKIHSALATVDDAAVPYVEPILGNTSAKVRQAALHVMIVVEAPKLLTYGLKLARDRNTEVRGTAYYALGLTEDSRAIPALVRALKDPDPNLRLSASWYLRQGKDGDWAAGKAALAKAQR